MTTEPPTAPSTPPGASSEELAVALARAEAENLTLRATIAELAESAARDSLTGLWNRKRIAELARYEIERATRYNLPVTLVAFDLDHFKAVNDAWGHAIGDEVLAAVATAARAACRATDHVGRWGGEEFLVVAPHTSLVEGRLLAERLRLLFETLDHPRVGPVTASLGVVDYRPGETVDAWIGRADVATYAAKRGGRNRVAIDADAVALDGAAPPLLVELHWHPSYRSGVNSIDLEHQALVRDANRLLAGTLEGRDRRALTELARVLVEDFAAHAASEEEVLRRVGWAGLEEHAALHRDIYARGRALVDDVAAGRATTATIFALVAVDIVAGHMLGEDRKYFPSLAARPSP